MKFLNPHPKRRINVALFPVQHWELPSRRSYCTLTISKGTSFSELFSRARAVPGTGELGFHITEVQNKQTTILLQSHSRNKMVAEMKTARSNTIQLSVTTCSSSPPYM